MLLSPFLPKDDALLHLPHYELWRVSGKNVEHFLQGQLTADIQNVTDNTIQQSALLNLKGRLLCLMDVLKWKNTYYLVLSHHEALILEDTLKKVALLSKITLSHESNYMLMGLYSHQKSDFQNLKLPQQVGFSTSTDSLYCYAILPHCYLLVLNKKNFNANSLSFKETLSPSLWHALQIAEKRFTLTPKTSGTFLIHRLNLQNTTTVSFQKGCYRGQEIVARTEYRSVLKHTVTIKLIETKIKLEAGSPCYSAANEIIGEIIDLANINKNTWIIAYSARKNEQDIFFEERMPS